MAIFTIALLAIMLPVASCSSPTSPSVSCPYTFYVSNQAEWNDAVDTIDTTYDNRQWTIVVVRDFELPGITTGYSFTQTDLTVTIRGNRRISLSDSDAGSLLRIGADQKIILQDVALEGISNNTDPLVRVVGGDLVMQGGSSISGNTNDPGAGGGDAYDGGGVRIDDDGSFTMHGGTIKGNSACCGGGVHLFSGTFTMINGIITGNSSLSNTATDNIGFLSGGGGVAIADGTFNMEGGVISSNQALNAFGGGVLVWWGGTPVINKTGGTIYGTDAIPAELANVAHGAYGHAAARGNNTLWRNATSDDAHDLRTNPAEGWEN